MNKNQSPAVVYYQIHELQEQIKKQIQQLNKAVRELNLLNASVGENPVDIQKIVDELLVKQIELDVIYRKVKREKIEEEISQLG